MHIHCQYKFVLFYARQWPRLRSKCISLTLLLICINSLCLFILWCVLIFVWEDFELALVCYFGIPICLTLSCIKICIRNKFNTKVIEGRDAGA